MTMRRRLGAAAVAVALVSVASGCASSPSTAATVGNTTVTMKSVDDAVEHCSKFINPSSEITPRQIISSTVIRGAAAQEVLDKRGAKLSDAERDHIVARNGMTALTSDQVCHTMVRNFAGLLHLLDVEGEKQAKADLSAVGVKVNPRLGSWDAGNLVVQDSSSLSQPFSKIS
ncbi:hypothetical protein [Cutibacterium modestum]|uniref:Lipoprotein n=1 Tax=Cutibacterium modestum HL044PA1 TaxID=765109 RepID=A0ABP2K812_9ACTN|nr:hypothetical protein [Cutibacterium modestum]EFS93058.1 hypothetical protein HMPREF9607_00690 [Cutibacterium modestum HL044PA1]